MVQRRWAAFGLRMIVCAFVAIVGGGCATQRGHQETPVTVSARTNRDIVQSAFEQWRAGTGGPFDLLADDAEWTIVGSSPRSKTYRSKREFMEEVIVPFNARVSRPLWPAIRGIYAEGETVVVRFDGFAPTKWGGEYRNSYAWFLEMRGGRIVRATAFFDTRTFDDFWNQQSP